MCNFETSNERFSALLWEILSFIFFGRVRDNYFYFGRDKFYFIFIFCEEIFIFYFL